MSDSVRDALARWYTRIGDADDERAGVALVRAAKTADQWIACDCLGTDTAPPLLAPSYLSEAATYYLRRMSGADRPEHRHTCPFYRDQSYYAEGAARRAYTPLAPAACYFASAKPLGEHLAQAPIDRAEDNRFRAGSVPKLARLLWQLLERADTITIPAIHEAGKPSIAVEFGRVTEAAKSFEIAPGIALSDLWFTHPESLQSKRIYARLRDSVAGWPAGHAPQAFLLVYASHVRDREIITPAGDSIVIQSDVARPPLRIIGRGPYLALISIAESGGKGGLAPVRAYAQPIQNGQHFVAIDSEAERALLALLLDLRWRLRERGVALRIRKPVFDIETEFGPCRPDFLIETFRPDRPGGSIHILELVGYADWPYRQRKDKTLSAMQLVAPIVGCEVDDVMEGTRLKAQLLEFLSTI